MSSQKKKSFFSFFFPEVSSRPAHSHRCGLHPVIFASKPRTVPPPLTNRHADKAALATTPAWPGKRSNVPKAKRHMGTEEELKLE